MADLTCGTCGSAVQAGALVCKVCLASVFPVGTPAGPPAVLTPAPDVSAGKGVPTAVCPRSWCGQEYPVGATVCPGCFDPVPAAGSTRPGLGEARTVSAIRISLPVGGIIGARPGVSVLLGRESTDARIADCLDAYDGVSRRHAEVVVGTGEVTVTDLGSTNGTYVDGVLAQRPVALGEGQHEVRLGRSAALGLEVLGEEDGS